MSAIRLGSVLISRDTAGKGGKRRDSGWIGALLGCAVVFGILSLGPSTSVANFIDVTLFRSFQTPNQHITLKSSHMRVAKNVVVFNGPFHQDHPFQVFSSNFLFFNSFLKINRSGCWPGSRTHNILNFEIVPLCGRVWFSVCERGNPCWQNRADISADEDAKQPYARSRGIIWPVLPDILPPKAEKAAHVWHTQPLLRIGFIVGSRNGRLTGVQPYSAPVLRAVVNLRPAAWHTTGTSGTQDMRLYQDLKGCC